MVFLANSCFSINHTSIEKGIGEIFGIGMAYGLKPLQSGLMAALLVVG